MIQEQITRVLLERLIVNRPHPWGLLITFIELIKVTFWQEFRPCFLLMPLPYVTIASSLAFFWMNRIPGTTSGAGISQGVHQRLRNFLNPFQDLVVVLNPWKIAWLVGCQTICIKASQGSLMFQ